MVREILVVELLGGMGDLLLALPAVHALARAHPQAAVRVLTFTPGSVLLAGDPYVTEVVATSDHSEGAPRRAVAAQLRRTPPDVAVTTTQYDGIGDLLAAAAPHAVTDLWRSPPPDEPVDRRFLRLLVGDGLVDPGDVDLPLRVHVTDDERYAGARLLGPARPVVLVPEAGMAVKRWPLPRWRALATRLGESVHVVAGSDPPLAAAVGGRPLPALGLRELAGLFAAVAERDGVVIGGDTGPLRLAHGAGARTVGLFGPTLAARYAPGPALQGLPGCAVRRPTSITEQRCWWSGSCPLSAAGPACLLDVDVEDVLAAVIGAG